MIYPTSRPPSSCNTPATLIGSIEIENGWMMDVLVLYNIIL